MNLHTTISCHFERYFELQAAIRAMRQWYLSGLDDSLEDEGEQENSCPEGVNHEEVPAPSKHASRATPAQTDKRTRKPRSMEGFLAF
jgi:hypothetical protein